MNKQEIQSKIEELEKRFAKFKELENELTTIKEGLKKPESKVFKPKIDDIYYYICSSGIIDYVNWKDTEIDNQRYALGNCFRTKEEAEFEVEKLKVIAELKRFALEHNEPIDWNNVKQNKYFIYFYYKDEMIDVDFWQTLKHNDIYFTSEELAQQAIKEIGEDKIKKYYLGVEDDE